MEETGKRENWGARHVNIVQLKRIREKFEPSDAFVARDPQAGCHYRKFFWQTFVEILWEMHDCIRMMIGVKGVPFSPAAFFEKFLPQMRDPK